MEFPPISKQQKEWNPRFLELILRQEENPRLFQEKQELQELSELIYKQSCKIPAIRLSARELAKCIGLSFYQIKKWIELGDLPARRMLSGRYELLSSEIFYALKAKGYNLFS